MFIANTPKPREATIDSIKYFDKKIELTTNEFNETLIIFDGNMLPLKVGDKIFFTGKRSEYRSEKQIVVEMIKVNLRT